MTDHPKKNRKRLPWYILFLSAALAGPMVKPAAAGLCEGVNALIVQARSNFSDGADQSAGALAGAEKCTMSRSEAGANAYHCTWGFSYRDAAASAFFREVDADLRTCLAGRAESAKDRGVNHPDTYDQRRYGLDDVIVTVSLKDKSALDRTFVFLGVYAAASD